MVGIWISGSFLQALTLLPSSSKPAQEDTGAKHDPHTSSSTALKFHIIIIPLLHMRSLRLRKGMCLAQGHTVHGRMEYGSLGLQRAFEGPVCSKTLLPKHSYT